MNFSNYINEVLLNSVLMVGIGIFPCLIVAFFMQIISNSIRRSMVKLFGDKVFIYLTAPGVAVHELGHALFCIIFGHKVVEIKLFSPEEDGTLGYVNHTYNPNNIYHRVGNFFIGIGPIILGLIVLSLVSRLLLPIQEYHMGDILSAVLSIAFWNTWQAWVWLYLAFTLISHITLSPPDLKGAAEGFFAIVAVILWGCLLFGWCGAWEEAINAAALGYFMAMLPILLVIISVTAIVAFVLRIIAGK